MRILILLVVLAIAPAQAATLDAFFQPPKTDTKGKIPATGPRSLVSVRVEYGTCTALGRFGIWEGGKTLKVPVNKMSFFDLPYRRTCSRIYWKNKMGNESKPSAVSILEAT